MLLRKDDPWNSRLEIPDVRNWRVVDGQGRKLGFVETVILDWKNNKAEAILIGPNDRFPIDQVEIGDDVVRLRTAVEDRVPMRTGEEAHASGTFVEAFRDHFQRAYARSDWSFDRVAEAYSFGRDMALDAHYSGRSYERAREDLRALWIMTHPRIGFEPLEDAVCYAYRLTKGREWNPMAGQVRDADSNVRGDARSVDSARMDGGKDGRVL